MKILLVAVNAKFIHSNPAVYYLREYAKEWKEQIEVVEYTINQQTESILADIYRKNPDVVAFSCYIWNWGVVEKLLNELPKVLPKVRLWVGGPEVSYDAPKRLKEFPMLTGIIIGEGEVTFRELAEHYCTGKGNLRDIRGLCLPEYGYTGMREAMNMDEVPFIYGDFSPFEHKIIYYETSRGCPFSCSYCLSSVDKKVRLRSFDLVKKELQIFLDHKVPQVKFVDRTFNCNHKHCGKIWNYILEHDNGVTNFHFEISADLLTEEELALLAKMRPGLVQLEIGVQSTNLDTIDEIRRTMNLNRLKEVVERIHEARNIHEHLDLIVGLPYEDFASFVKSFNEVYRMRPDQLQMGFLKVLKGSYMENQVDNYKLAYSSYPPYEVLSTKWISYAEVLRLKSVEEMVELYYNSNQFSQTLGVLEQAFESPYAMFEALSGFFEENGYFTNQPARSYRYDVLLAFATKYDGEREALYKELLTYDIYLRENCKSRPSFATDLSAYRSILHEQNKNRKNHMEVFYYPVWEEPVHKRIRRLEEPAFLCFDYDNRNPLNHNAKVSNAV